MSLSTECAAALLSFRYPSLLNIIEEINNDGPFPAGTLLVSWDVVSMFPNIDNNLDLTAVKNALDTRERQMPSMKCFLEAVKISLDSRWGQTALKSVIKMSQI